MHKGILWETNEFVSVDSQSDSMRLECMDFFSVTVALIQNMQSCEGPAYLNGGEIRKNVTCVSKHSAN